MSKLGASKSNRNGTVKKRGTLLRVGVDIGGTFTDVVLHDPAEDAWSTAKVLTRAADPAESVRAGLDAVLDGRAVSEVGLISHATTLGINAIIERKGARTALLTTSGITDVIEMGTGQRYDIYELFPEYPEALVPQELRFGIGQRTGPDGAAIAALDRDQIESVVRDLGRRGVEAVAVCFLHSYAAPDAELAAAAILGESLPDVPTSLSGQVVPEIREYPRVCTVVANAYIQPTISSYLEHLQESLHGNGFEGRLLTMLSSGATGSVGAAGRFPVRILESGPAAGGAFAERVAARHEISDLAVFDMGGTTAKVSLVRAGALEKDFELEVARMQRFTPGSGIPIKAPTLALFEIGAGGGSIASVDALGLVVVGPESAGADPGPACYGRGGELPTVTDSDFVLGYVSPASFLGGQVRFDGAAASAAVERHVAAELDAPLDDGAWAIHAAANDAMANAVRVHLAERGVDPASMSLVAIGGAGPVHAERVARAAGMRHVLIPPVPGVGSAAGLLLAPIAFDLSRSWPGLVEEADWEQIADLYRSLEVEARAQVEDSGVSPASISISRSASMQIEGQVHELEVSLDANELDAENVSAAFRRVYHETFHHPPLERPLRVVTWRLRASGPPPRWRPPAAGHDAATGSPNVPHASRPAYFPEGGGWLETPVFDRHALDKEADLTGPALIEDSGSTVLVCPASKLSLLGDGTLELEVDEL